MGEIWYSIFAKKQNNYVMFVTKYTSLIDRFLTVKYIVVMSAL